MSEQWEGGRKRNNPEKIIGTGMVKIGGRVRSGMYVVELEFRR